MNAIIKSLFMVLICLPSTSKSMLCPSASLSESEKKQMVTMVLAAEDLGRKNDELIKRLKKYPTLCEEYIKVRESKKEFAEQLSIAYQKVFFDSQTLIAFTALFNTLELDAQELLATFIVKLKTEEKRQKNRKKRLRKKLAKQRYLQAARQQ